MALGLGFSAGYARGGGGPFRELVFAIGRGNNISLKDGTGYGSLSVTSTSSFSTTGPLVITNDGIAGKPAGYLWGLVGARVNGSAPAWTDGSGNALADVWWRGPQASATFLATGAMGTGSWAEERVTNASGATLSGFATRTITGNAVVGRHIYYYGYGLYPTSISYVLRKNGSTRYVQIGDMDTSYLNIDLDTGAVTAKSANATARTRLVSAGVVVATMLLSAGQASYSGIALINSPTAGCCPAFDATGYAVDATVATSTGSVGQSGLVVTNGTTVTPLAETVTFTTGAFGADFSLMGELDFREGLPASTVDVFVSGADKIQVNSTGKLIVTDGTLTTTSTASFSAASGQKFGIARTAAGSTSLIGSTIETGGAAVDWNGNTAWTIGTGAPVQRITDYPTRALTSVEMAAYV